MSYEIKDNTFTLFNNDKKGNDLAPDFKGRGLVNGKDVQIAVWKKTAKSGTEYLSGSISEYKSVDKHEEPKQEETKVELDVISDTIPF